MSVVSFVKKMATPLGAVNGAVVNIGVSIMIEKSRSPREPEPRRRRIPMVLGAVAVALTSICLWTTHRPAERFGEGPPGENELRIVTWNVGYFTPLKVKSARASDTDAIVKVLYRIDAHLIVLQELGSKEQAIRIAKALGDGWKARSIATGPPGQFLGVLAVLPILDVAVKEAGGKYMLGIRLQASGEQDIFLLALHAPHPGRGRPETVEYILAGIAWARDRSEQIIILAGDLNYHFSTEADIDTQELYGEFRTICADSTAGIGPTYYARVRIDHVFHAPKTLSVVASGTGLVDTPPRLPRVPGWRDHRPVVVTLSLHAMVNPPSFRSK